MEDISPSGQDISPEISPTVQPPGTGVALNLTDIDVLKDRLEQQKANKLKAEVTKLNTVLCCENSC